MSYYPPSIKNAIYCVFGGHPQYIADVLSTQNKYITSYYVSFMPILKNAIYCVFHVPLDPFKIELTKITIYVTIMQIFQL